MALNKKFSGFIYAGGAHVEILESRLKKEENNEGCHK